MKTQHMMDNTKSSRDSKQILYKVTWESNRYGGKIGKQKPFDEGEDLVRLATLKEIVPEKEAYFIRPNNHGVDYYLIYKGFSKLAEYGSIKSMVNAKCVYVYNKFKI
tara:strand:- start:2146 stop:2466 length:321 start_codon:yes stop_codon:yes gene_type:complete